MKLGISSLFNWLAVYDCFYENRTKKFLVLIFRQIQVNYNVFGRLVSLVLRLIESCIHNFKGVLFSCSKRNKVLYEEPNSCFQFSIWKSVSTTNSSFIVHDIGALHVMISAPWLNNPLKFYNWPVCAMHQTVLWLSLFHTLENMWSMDSFQGISNT